MILLSVKASHTFFSRDSASLTQIKGLQKALSQAMCSDKLNPLRRTAHVAVRWSSTDPQTQEQGRMEGKKKAVSEHIAEIHSQAGLPLHL